MNKIKLPYHHFSHLLLVLVCTIVICKMLLIQCSLLKTTNHNMTAYSVVPKYRAWPLPLN